MVIARRGDLSVLESCKIVPIRAVKDDILLTVWIIRNLKFGMSKQKFKTHFFKLLFFHGVYIRNLRQLVVTWRERLDLLTTWYGLGLSMMHILP